MNNRVYIVEKTEQIDGPKTSSIVGVANSYDIADSLVSNKVSSMTSSDHPFSVAYDDSNYVTRLCTLTRNRDEEWVTFFIRPYDVKTHENKKRGNHASINWH